MTYEHNINPLAHRHTVVAQEFGSQSHIQLQTKNNFGFVVYRNNYVNVGRHLQCDVRLPYSRVMYMFMYIMYGQECMYTSKREMHVHYVDVHVY